MTAESIRSLVLAAERLRSLTTPAGEEYTSPESLAAAMRDIMGDPDRLLLFTDTVNRILYAAKGMSAVKPGARIAG